MKPSQMKIGDRFILVSQFGNHEENEAVFVKRFPRRQGRKAFSWVRVPAFAGLSGPNDQGYCEVSDYDFARRAKPLKEDLVSSFRQGKGAEDG